MKARREGSDGLAVAGEELPEGFGISAGLHGVITEGFLGRYARPAKDSHGVAQ
jgi:hypothetical protein